MVSSTATAIIVRPGRECCQVKVAILIHQKILTSSNVNGRVRTMTLPVKEHAAF